MSAPFILVRPPTASFSRALSPHPDRDTINPDLAVEQHQAYMEALRQAGAQVEILPPLEAFPDSCFVEDNALILENRAFLCSMRAESRRGEPAHMLPRLEQEMPVEVIQPPVFGDGGDVIETEKAVYIGQSKRTDSALVDFFNSRLTKPVIPVDVRGILHLKTGASYLGNDTFLVHAEGCDWKQFNARQCLQVDPDEAYAANVVTLGNCVIMPSGFKKTQRQIEQAGYQVFPVPMSEFEKADGGVTCLHLRLPSNS